MDKKPKNVRQPHWRQGHWKTNSVTGQQTWVPPKLIAPGMTQEEIEAMQAEQKEKALKQKRSAAAKKAWETIRRKKAEEEERAKKKKYRSIDDEGEYGNV